MLPDGNDNLVLVIDTGTTTVPSVRTVGDNLLGVAITPDGRAYVDE
jgi:DNA-binding beta-propeller fold protein YncE